jgi:hypothetical protein
MAELQFKVDTTALQTIQSTELKANFEEMEQALTEFVKPYESVIVTEDAISLAKGDRAKLRSVAKHIDNYRKVVKQSYTEPLKTFEDKCKQLTAIIDRGVLNLDAQVKQFEERIKEEKYFGLQEYFGGVQANMKYPEYVEWMDIRNDKWGNKTYDTEQAKRDIDLACFNIDHDVQSIIDLKSEFELTLLDNYKKSHLLYETLQMNDRLMADKKRKEEEQKRLEEQYKQKRAEEEARAAAAKVIEKTNPTPKAETTEAMFVATFKVYGTYEELTMLRSFMTYNKLSHTIEGMTATDKPVEAVLG